jgi:hypothetical protein
MQIQARGALSVHGVLLVAQASMRVLPVGLGYVLCSQFGAVVGGSEAGGCL